MLKSLTLSDVLAYAWAIVRAAKQFVSTGCARMANDHAVVVDLDCAQSELMLYVCFAVDKQGGHPVLQEVTIVPCHPACSL
jgi:hypothetical protein